MKNIRKNNLIRKIAIIILFIMCFNILIPNNNVTAKSYPDEGDDVGGSLFQPIMDFLVFLADSVLNVLQHNFIALHDVVYSQTEASSTGEFSLGWLGVALLGIGVVAYGVSLVLSGGLSSVLAGVLWTAGGIAGTVFACGEFSDLLAGQFDVPFIAYNPYAIFSGEVPALDINFINPGESKKIIDKKGDGYYTDESDIHSDGEIVGYSHIVKFAVENGMVTKPDGWNPGNPDSYDDWGDSTGIELVGKYASKILSPNYVPGYASSRDDTKTETYYVNAPNGATLKIVYYFGVIDTYTEWGYDTYDSPERYLYQIYKYEMWEENAPETIAKEYQSSAAILQRSIATWYKVLRRIALVGLLSVLVYVAIRIILSAAAADKAKYKKLFIDWLVAVCMLFVLHYIMVFVLTLSTKLSTVTEEAGVYQMVYYLPADTTIGGHELVGNPNIVEELPNNEYSNIEIKTDENGNPRPIWNGEFMGYIRLRAGSNYSRNQMAYGLMYLVLVIYVCMFTFMYLRRALYMAFLTMIAPLIALTYPIDKIKDGQAQAFGLWLREYIFNALIQPVHLIIYTMTISTVIELAYEHPVYALVALSFMLPAEKFIRNMFGFQKASTVNPLGGAVGGAALMTAVSKLSRLGRKKDNKKEEKGQDKIRTADKDKPGIDIPDVDIGGTSSGNSAGVRMTNSAPLPDSSASTSRNTQNNTNANLFAQSQQPNNTPANNAPTNNVQTAKKQRFRRTKNAMTSMANRSRNRMLKAKPLRTIGRFTAMGAGAATLGMVGLAAGISTGDFGNVLKYTGTGIGVGGALGKSLGDRAMDKASQIKEDFKEGYMGSEEYNNAKLDREYFNGQGYQEMLDNSSLMPNLSGSERARALKQEIEEYRSNGISDNKQITSCMKAGLSSEEGACAIKIANKLKAMNLDSTGKAAYEAAYKQQLGSQFSSDTINNIWNVIEANM